jgi:tetratricopeptide (TPR) repeat protein
LLEDDHVASGALGFLGRTCVDLGDAAQGIGFLEESLQLARKRADIEQVIRGLNGLGDAHSALGNFDLAATLFEEGLQLAREHRHLHGIAFIAANVARTHVARGEVERALSPAREALEAASNAKSKLTTVSLLDVIAWVVAAAGDWTAAARMLGAAEAGLKLVGYQRQTVDARVAASAITATKRSLPETEFESAFESGHRLSMDEAMDEARAWLEKFATAAPSVVVEFPRQRSSVLRR